MTEAAPSPAVIVLKLPFDLLERLNTFPFLHALKLRYPDADLHFITSKKWIEVLNLLPFKAYYHEWDDEELINPLEVHRFAVNFILPRVDIYVAFSERWNDAWLGYFLRAKERWGFAQGLQRLTYTRSLPRPRGHHPAYDFAQLFTECADASFPERLRVLARDLEPIVEDPRDRPYVAINLSPLRGTQIEAEWHELIEKFQNQRFILFCSEEPEKMQLLLPGFLANLRSSNQVEALLPVSWVELARLLAYADGVITYEGPLATLSAYVGAKTLVLYSSLDPQRTAPFDFSADLMVLDARDPNYGQSAPAQQVRPRPRFNLERVFEKAVEFFRLP
jgi:ADP-heptose:LPS heptosyltransferase